MGVTRRQVMLSAPVVAGMGLIESMIPELLAQSPQAQPLNQTLLNTVHANIGNALTRIVNKTANSSDYQTIYNQTASLISEFTIKNFDAGFKQTAATQFGQASSSSAWVSTYWNATSWAQTVYNAVKPYAPNLSYQTLLARMESMPQFAPGYPASALQQQTMSVLSYYSHNGALPKIEAFNSTIIQPMEDGPQDPNGVCQLINAMLWFLGAIFTILAIMCAFPEPAVVVICPAAVLIGILVAIVAALAPIVCNL